MDYNSTYYYTSAYCTTTATTANKSAAISGAQELTAGKYFQIWMLYDNTTKSALTLNVSGKGAKPIYINGTASSSTNYTLPRGAYIVYYDGTNYHFRTDNKLPGNIAGDAATVGGFTVGKAVPSTAVFTDTWIPLSTTQAGYVDTAPNDTTKFLRGDASWAALPKATTSVTGITTVGAAGGAAAYSHGTHVSASTVKAALSATASTTAKKYLKDTGSFVQVSYNDLSDIPDDFEPTDHDHGRIENDGTIDVTNGWALATGDSLLVVDNDTNKIERTNISFNTSSAAYCLTQAGTWVQFNNYSHPSEDGWYHIPSGGESGQFLAWNSTGTAKWVANPNTHYTTHLYVNTNSLADTTTEATTNDATYIHLYDNDTHRDVIQFAGAKGITLASNANGKITIEHSHTDITAKTSYAATATTANANGGTIKLTDIKYDAQGHITASTDRTITLSVPVKSVATLTGAITAADLLTQLGLESAMHFRGITTTDISYNHTTDTASTTQTVVINNTSITATSGDVVLYDDEEYVWANGQWNLLGSEGSYKLKQTAVNTATAENDTATTFVYSVTQDAQGVITVKTRPLPIKNNTSVGSLGWSSATADNVLITSNTLAYWNGAYKGAGTTADPYTSNLTIVGTISKGTWQGTKIGVGYGGTGNTSVTANRIIYSESTSKLSSAASIYASSSSLAINSTTAPANSGNFQVKGTSTMQTILPESTNTYNLGQANSATGSNPDNGIRWSHLYIGTADTYGAYGKPIYWNAGAPAATYPVQYTTWTIPSGSSSVTIEKAGKYFTDTYVLSIVVTSGEDKLPGALTWNTDTADKLIIATTGNVSDTVSGYVLTARADYI